MQGEAARSQHVIAGALAGTILEAYDFTVYGFMLVYIANAFFPKGDDVAALLSATAAFGAGFLMRPLGAVVLGGYTDRRGRRAGLSVSLALMALGTALVGLTPGYGSLGVAAPVAVVAGRLLQGFSAGGEFGGAMALLIEEAGPGRRGRIGGLQWVAQGASLLLGSLVAAITGALLPKADMAAWGWRLPFLLGLLILPVGLYLRTAMPRKDDRLRAAAAIKPVSETLRSHLGAVVKGIALVVPGTVSVYVLLVYMPTFAARALGIAAPSALLVGALAVSVCTATGWVSGTWSDRIGRPRVMFVGALGLFGLAAPAFTLLVARPTVAALLAAQVALSCFAGVYNGTCMTFVSELYPSRVRASGFSLSYNVAIVLFGGFAPFVITYLLATTGSKAAPAYYLTAAAAVGLTALAFVRRAQPSARR